MKAFEQLKIFIVFFIFTLVLFATMFNIPTEAMGISYAAELKTPSLIRDKIAYIRIYRSKILFGNRLPEGIQQSGEIVSEYLNGNIVFFGDSWTEGTGAENEATDYTIFRGSPEYRYCNYVCQALNMKEFNFASGGAGFVADYIGKPNNSFMAQTITAEESMTREEKLDTRLVVIAGGLNDGVESSWMDYGLVASAVGDMIVKSYNLFPNALVVLAFSQNCPALTLSDRWYEWVDLINADVAWRFPDVYLIPEYANVPERDESLFNGDNVHPNREGHRILGEFFTEKLLPLANGEYDNKTENSLQKSTENENHLKIVSCTDVCEYTEELYAFLNVAGSKYLALGGLKNPQVNNWEYYRLDAFSKTSYSGVNNTLAVCTAGGTVRFMTDSKSFVIRAVMRDSQTDMKHFAPRGAYGFDAYVGSGQNREYLGGPMQFMTDPDYMEETVEIPGKGFREIMIDLPQYAGITELLIGLERDSFIAPVPERKYGAICFYGSSITQGACASRPGSSYTNVVCRMLDCDCINLGFSGSAHGETSIAEYINTRDISAFIMDYDHNTETAEELSETHYEFYKSVRQGHPDIPIIFVSKPYYVNPKEKGEDIEARQAVITETFRKAVDEGDTNVYLLLSDGFFSSEDPNVCTVDMVHPNDLGHYMIAKRVADILRKVL